MGIWLDNVIVTEVTLQQKEPPDHPIHIVIQTPAELLHTTYQSLEHYVQLWVLCRKELAQTLRSLCNKEHLVHLMWPLCYH